MKISLTKKQYLKLLKLVYLGNWMVNAIHCEEHQASDMNEIEQYIYSFAKEYGFETYIEFDRELGEYLPTRLLEEDEEITRYMEEYDDHNFWEEIVCKLAHRDFEKTYGADVIHKMDLFERIEKEQPFLEKYWDEIEKHGLDRLMVIEQSSRSKSTSARSKLN